MHVLERWQEPKKSPKMPCSPTELSALRLLVSDSESASFCSNTSTAGEAGSGALVVLLAMKLQNITQQLSTLQSKQAESNFGLDTQFLLSNATLVFIMQMGLAMFVAGTVRAKNISAILMKSAIDTCITAVGFYCLGYGFARGEVNNAFIGTQDFALAEMTRAAPGHRLWHLWGWEWVFCATSATILAGAVAERGTFISYMIWTAIYSMWVYPVVAYWSWDVKGWLSASNPNAILGMGAIDFAGSGVVHTQGGFAALVAAALLGPRIGRFEAGANMRLYKGGHNSPLYLLGTFFMWLGWYGFNPGSNLAVHNFQEADVVARTAVTTTLAAAGGGIVSLLLVYRRQRSWDMFAVCCGVLGGLVSNTAGCSVFEPWAALLCGALSAPWVLLGDDLMDWLRIDDPCQAFPMHGLAGIWGMLCVGLLAKEEYVVQVYDKQSGRHMMGLFYGGHGQLLLCQIIAVLVVIAWVCFWAGLFFWGMKKAGLLRIPLEDEAVGMDAATMATDQAEVTRAHYTKVGHDASVKRAPGTVLLANASDQAARGVSMPQPFEVAAERSDGLALSSAAVWADIESGKVAPTSLEQQVRRLG